MLPQQQDVEMVQRLGEMEFSLYGREGGALVKGVAQFKYLRRPLDKKISRLSGVTAEFQAGA